METQFQSGAARHRSCEADAGFIVPAAGKAGDLQQMPRVDVGRHAGKQHAVVAGVLTLGAQSMDRPPYQRVVPVDGAGDLRHHLRRPVVSGDVREFMEQNNAQALGVPAFGIRRRRMIGRRQPQVIGIASSWWQSAIFRRICSSPVKSVSTVAGSEAGAKRQTLSPQT